MTPRAVELEADRRSRPVPPTTERAFVMLVQWSALAFSPVLGTVAWINRDLALAAAAGVSFAAGIFAWQQRLRNRPRPMHLILVVVALMSALVPIQSAAVVGSMMVAVAAFAALGTLFIQRRYFLPYLFFLGGVWAAELVLLNDKFLQEAEPLSNGQEHNIFGLAIQLAVFLVAAVALNGIKHALAASGTRYEMLFDMAPVALWEEDFTEVGIWLQGLRAAGVDDLEAHFAANPQLIREAIQLIRVTDVNQATVDLVEASQRADLLGHIRMDEVTPEAQPAFEAMLYAIWAGRSRASAEFVGTSLSGRTFDGVLYWQAGRALDGLDLSKVIVAMLDVSKEREAKRALAAAKDRLAKSEREYRLLAANSTDMISRHNPDGDYIYVSDAARTLLGMAPDELIGTNAYDYFHPEDLAAILESHAANLTVPDIQTVQYRIRRKSGHYLWVETTSHSLRDPESGEVTEIQTATRNITDRKQAEDDLVAAKEAAEAATRAKSEFLATMSHEIRTPMNAIVGMTELTLSTDLTPEQREYLGTVKSAVDGLLGLVNDVLDLSKIEAGRLELETIPFSLGDTVGDTVRTLAVRAAEKGLQLRYELAPDVPDGVVGDPGRLRQVLYNLVSNAIKFTHVGSVTIDVQLESLDADQQATLCLSVSDTGIGIPDDKLDTIFEAFSQADGSTTRRYGGTGLGLSIARELVGMMKGEISADSEVGVGSTFSFTARFMALSDQRDLERTANSHGAKDGMVIVVSDTPAERRSLVEILRQSGFSPMPVPDAASALHAAATAAERAAGADAVVIDVVDGAYATCKALLAGPTFANVPVLLLTGSGQRGDAAEYRRLGVAAYLTKPLEHGELVEAVRSAIATPADADVPLITRHWLRERRRRFHVLVADDSPTNRHLATALLRKHGHTAVAACDGNEAVAAWEKEAFDVILMDVSMPECDGLEATEAIRALEAGTDRRIPIIALTAHAMEGDRDKCLEAGMDAYVSKPFQADELFATIAQLVPGSGQPTVAPVEVAVPDAHAVVINHHEALQRVEGNLELLAEMVDLFFTEYPAVHEAVEEGLSGHDLEMVASAAHQLKGNLATFAAHAAADAARELEALARAGANGEVVAAWSRLQEAINRVEPELQNMRAGGSQSWAS